MAVSVRNSELIRHSLNYTELRILLAMERCHSCVSCEAAHRSSTKNAWHLVSYDIDLSCASFTTDTLDTALNVFQLPNQPNRQGCHGHGSDGDWKIDCEYASPSLFLGLIFVVHRICHSRQRCHHRSQPKVMQQLYRRHSSQNQ